MNVTVEEDILFYAFRYALGRSTYAVFDVTRELKRVWSQMNNQTRIQIQQEIQSAIDSGQSLGMKMDEAAWVSILELPVETVHPFN